MLANPSIFVSAPTAMVAKAIGHGRILISSTRYELAKRYSGSLFGKSWLALQPAILLAIYLFVYLVIFRMKFPGYSQWDYVLFVFCGLIPYIGFSEALNAGCVSIRQNMHLVNNIMMPVELLPVRSVLLSMVGQLISMGFLLLLVLPTRGPGIQLCWLPMLFVLQFIWLFGITWILSAVGVLLPDVSYFVNFATVFLMFVSPIGFKPDMVPVHFRFMIYLNPVHYMVQLYRDAVTENTMPAALDLGIYTAICLVCFALGSVVFYRFKDSLVENQ